MGIGSIIGIGTTGPMTVNNYDAPLDKMPVFVRAGALIPMWPAMQFAGEKPVNPLTLDVYPAGETYFDLYEDDGRTRAALPDHAFAMTRIQCSAGRKALLNGGHVLLTVGVSIGQFDGMLPFRSYDVGVDAPALPSSVALLNGSDARFGPCCEWMVF